jgi:predicted nucleotidyltransferase
MPIKDFSLKTHIVWNEIINAKEQSKKNKKLISDTVFENDLPPFDNDMDLVIFGSTARDECTKKSDVDWTLLLDGQSDPNDDATGRFIKKKMSETGLADPSPSGLFGQITFSHDLIHYIGGEDDTNHNLSRRILLLLESERIGPAKSFDSSGTAYSRVILGILERYISNDSAFRSDHGKKDNVPRFLLNDIVRFWRTMCVDFAYKQREQGGEKWALRNIKLRMSRKIIFLKGLLMCASSYQNPEISVEELKLNFNEIVSLKALDFIVEELIKYNIPDKFIIQLLNAYNRFLELLNDNTLREKIKKLPMKDVYLDKEFLEARNNAHLFQEALDHIFFNEDTPLKQFTLKYGLF